ncbi:MAG: DUF4159 domain-containing protein [Phycisphaera sp.]|nr:DUF4159 domain-containing protein [Phycisphaera sp.]
MQRHGRVIGIALAMVLAVFLGAPRPAQAVTDDEVEAGIKKLVAYLFSQQNPNGHWDLDQPENDVAHQGMQWGGKTALVTYALLKAGVSYQDPRLERALEFLKTAELKGTYAVALRSHVWGRVPDSFKPYQQKDLYWLIEASHKVSSGGLGWRYVQDAKDFDNSVSQYGLLGVWEAAKRGLPVGQGLWKGVEDHFLAEQNDEGGWGYGGNHGDGSRGSMVAAGVTCLFVTQNYLHSMEYKTCGVTRNSELQKRIDKGLAWFGKNFSPTQNPNGGHYHYYMVGVERVGLASGIRYFNGKDWYAEGAKNILSDPGNNPVDRAFSLIFLVAGRYPLLVNKLSIPDKDWNNRPRDVANATQWVSDEVEREMNWQVVDINTPAEDWLTAPLLYIASHEALELTDEQEQKIKRYIDLGGTLITVADCNSIKFTKSINDLMAKLYPQYKLQTLSPDDELMNMVFKIRQNRMGVQTLNNGIRHIVLHVPRSDLSWVLHSQNQSDPTAWQFFANAYYYATEKGRMRPRLDQHFIARSGNGGREITVGRVKYQGNWDPEPLSWEIQSNFMFNEGKASIVRKVVDLDKLNESGVKFAHLVGTGRVQFSDAQIHALQQYAQNGGTILLENAGGQGTDFVESVMEMVMKAFPNDRLRPVGPATPVISGNGIGGYDVSQVVYRAYALLKMGRMDAPRLLAVSVNGEPRIFLSGEDLTEAMLDQPVWGVFGYASESAHRLMSNLVLYGSQ